MIAETIGKLQSSGINFTYKFGHLKFKKEKQPDDNSPDDSIEGN